MLLSDADTNKLVTEVFDQIKTINDEIVKTIKSAKNETDMKHIYDLRIERDKVVENANFTTWFRG